MTETTLKAVADCRVGMKVRHMSRSAKSGGAGLGEIVDVARGGVLVVFASGARGLFDDGWFKSASSWLECVDE